MKRIPHTFLLRIVLGTVAVLVAAPAGAQAPHAHQPGQKAVTNPDHHFLRDLADHNEAMVYMAHSAMQMKHAHSAGTDAAGMADVVQDARKTELVALLRKAFRDEREPTPPPALKQEVDSVMRFDSEAFEKAWADFTLRHHGAAVKMIDRAKPRRADVRTLARRLRAQYVKEMAAARAQQGEH